MRAETTTHYIGLITNMEMLSPSCRKKYKIGFFLGYIDWHVVDSAGAASWDLHLGVSQQLYFSLVILCSYTSGQERI